MQTKEKLIQVQGRAKQSDIDKLKAANINISALIRDAIARAARQVK